MEQSDLDTTSANHKRWTHLKDTETSLYNQDTITSRSTGFQTMEHPQGYTLADDDVRLCGSSVFL